MMLEREILDVILIFLLCSSKINVAFKITI